MKQGNWLMSITSGCKPEACYYIWTPPQLCIPREACLWRDRLKAFAIIFASAFAASCALSNIGEMFQSNQRVWRLFDDLFGDEVIGCRFEPSLSLLDASQASFRATSAFFLQAFSQSCVVVGFVPDSFS